MHMYKSSRKNSIRHISTMINAFLISLNKCPFKSSQTFLLKEHSLWLIHVTFINNLLTALNIFLFFVLFSSCFFFFIFNLPTTSYCFYRRFVSLKNHLFYRFVKSGRLILKERKLFLLTINRYLRISKYFTSIIRLLSSSCTISFDVFSDQPWW